MTTSAVSGGGSLQRVSTAAGVIVLVVLGLVVATMTINAWPAFSQLGSDYFFGTRWSPSTGRYGIVPLVYGTLVVSLMATLMAVPVSIGIALFMAEVSGRRSKGPVGLTIDVLAAVPSVVFGLWGFYELVPLLQPLFGRLSELTSGIPVVGRVLGPSSGAGFMTAGLVLALMITPLITSVTREVLATVPHNDRAGALALGATRWEMITGVVLPHAAPGISGAVLLGLGRAMGETVAVALLIGASPQVSANLLGGGETMPAQIFRSLSESTGTLRSALFGLAVCLFILTLATNLAAGRIIEILKARSRGER